MIREFDFEKVPVVEIVNEILIDSSKKGASDIHFDPKEDHMLIRIRIDGILHNYATIPNSIKKNLITRIKIISGMNITESRLPQDGAIKTTIQNVNLDLRVSCIPTNEGEKIVIRILDYSMSLAGIESLGFSEKNFKKVLKMISTPNGIILVTGATGSGKSTTVYSILQRLNNEETNVITVEDPVEMNVEGVNQIQTNSEIGLTFAAALRSILRQDPNVIMIGEIRDTETAKIAVRASITGHLVLSTIHTNNSLNTIERLLDMDVERYLLASALEGIISQVLARKLCPHCKKLRKTNEYEKELFRTVLNKEVNEIYVAEGCEECGNGYKGRVAIHEVLLFNQKIRDAISTGISREALRDLVYQSDVDTLLEDGLQKVLNGLTTVEEVLKLIELEDDEKGSKAYGLKRALNNTKVAKESEKNTNNNLQQPNPNLNNQNIQYSNPNMNNQNVQYSNSNLNNQNIKYSNSNMNNQNIKYSNPNMNNQNIKYSNPNLNNQNVQYPNLNLNNQNMQYPNMNNQNTQYSNPNLNNQQQVPQTLNDLINNAQ